MIPVTKKSDWSGKTHTKDINITPEQLEKKDFSHLGFLDKNFMLYGWTPEEIDEMDSGGDMSNSEKRYHK